MWSGRVRVLRCFPHMFELQRRASIVSIPQHSDAPQIGIASFNNSSHFAVITREKR